MKAFQIEWLCSHLTTHISPGSFALIDTKFCTHSHLILALLTRKLAAAKEKLEKQQGEGERVAALEEQVIHPKKWISGMEKSADILLFGCMEQARSNPI